MNLYTIGDLHLSLGCDKPMDIFSGWNDYVNRLQKNWNSIIKPDDTTVIVGDISWGMTLEQAKKDFEFIHNLKGTKIILKGNHDYWFSTKKKVDDFLLINQFDSIKILFNNAYEFGNYSICGTRGWLYEQIKKPEDQKILDRESGRLRLSLNNAILKKKQPIAFLHYPPVYYTNECREIIDVLNEYNVHKCYYGHIHGPGCYYAIDGDYQGISYRLVSCDYTEFKPVKVL